MRKQLDSARLIESRKMVGWQNASSEAKEWWCELEEVNKDREDLVAELAEKLQRRSATVDDFFLVCAYSGRQGVRENLAYLDLVYQDRPTFASSNELHCNERH